MPETGRSWAGLGWAGLGGTHHQGTLGKLGAARHPSKLSIGLALFDPDHRAVSCTPSRTRPRTGSQGLDAARLLACCCCCFYKPVNPVRWVTALPCLRSPSPRNTCLVPHFALRRCCEGLMLARPASRTVAFSSRPAACGYEIAVSCRLPLSFSLSLPILNSPGLAHPERSRPASFYACQH